MIVLNQCIKLNKNKTNSQIQFITFCRSGVGLYKRILLTKLSKKHCNEIRFLVSNFDSLIGIPKDIISQADYIYNFLKYSINCISYSLDDLGNIQYFIEYSEPSKFGSAQQMILLLKIVEFGTANLRPYGLFSTAFTEFKLEFINRYNNLF